MRLVLPAFLISFLLWACQTYRQLPETALDMDWKSKTLPDNPQPDRGDPDAGWHYMQYGGFVGSGYPFEFLEPRLRNLRDTLLARDGNSRHLPPAFNAFIADNGVELVSGNCLTCHASMFQGELVVGLGNSFSDFTQNTRTTARVADWLIRAKYRKNTPEREAYADFGKYYIALGSKIVTPVKGVNPAFRLEEACMQHRDPVDLSYQRKPRYQTMKYTLASDVPPLWHVAKKQALYYNGMGRGSYAKLLMQASVLGVVDTSQARRILHHFDDVLAWAASIQPPKYPDIILLDQVDRGRVVFEAHCSKCHGHYGEHESYPNKLVALNQVGTDPYYALYFAKTSHMADWYNQSWFAQSAPHSSMEPDLGYVAPPLDGIWATAPYLHNGSVPTLEALLNSALRPRYWARSGRSDDYNLVVVGWNYEVLPKPDRKAPWLYNTDLPGYGNQGHTYGDSLSVYERRSLLEYLKTL